MSEPVLKIAQIDVLVGNVLKSEPIFLSLSGQVRLPISQIEGAIEVPNDILIGRQLIVDSIFEFPHNDSFLDSFQVHAKQFVEACC